MKIYDIGEAVADQREQPFAVHDDTGHVVARSEGGVTELRSDGTTFQLPLRLDFCRPVTPGEIAAVADLVVRRRGG